MPNIYDIVLHHCLKKSLEAYSYSDIHLFEEIKGFLLTLKTNNTQEPNQTLTKITQ